MIINLSSIRVKITQGAINHSYLNIHGFQKFFPADAFGKSNKDGSGIEIILKVSGLPQRIYTDIDSDKIIRRRGWFREFIRIHNIKAGDYVFIEKTGDREYKVSPAK
jgi:hypothetical protein